jgi:hypothetical protein
MGFRGAKEHLAALSVEIQRIYRTFPSLREQGGRRVQGAAFTQREKQGHRPPWSGKSDRRLITGVLIAALREVRGGEDIGCVLHLRGNLAAVDSAGSGSREKSCGLSV